MASLSFNWSNSEILEPLTRCRYWQGRLLSLNSAFVHSYELSEIKKHIYTDLSVRGLSVERLKGWHASLFPTGYAGVKKIKIGALNVNEDIEKFILWWKEPPVEMDPVLRSGLAFFWFFSLSPFEEGNFDLSCALAELALNEAEGMAQRRYDLSIQLEENRQEAVEIAGRVLRGNGDITDWMIFYLNCYQVAVEAAFLIADQDAKKDQFWKTYSSFDLNTRQRKFLNLMLTDNLAEITNRFYVSICKTSRESAKRDLTELVKFGILQRGDKKGRSVTYALVPL